jgi:hypothetical protein
MSLYVSEPGGSEPNGSDGENSPSARPEINLNVLNQKFYRTRKLPIFRQFNNMGSRNTVNSKQHGNAPFFTNAKPAWMLERGWVRSRDHLQVGQRGLFTEKDGPEILARVIDVDNPYPYNHYLYTFLDTTTGKLFEAYRGRFERWDFYDAVEPVPFVPRRAVDLPGDVAIRELEELSNNNVNNEQSARPTQNELNNEQSERRARKELNTPKTHRRRTRGGRKNKKSRGLRRKA